MCFPDHDLHDMAEPSSLFPTELMAPTLPSNACVAGEKGNTPGQHRRPVSLLKRTFDQLLPDLMSPSIASITGHLSHAPLFPVF